MNDFEKGNQAYFPLQALRFDPDKAVTLDHVISYSIIEFAYYLSRTTDLSNTDYERTSDFLSAYYHCEYEDDLTPEAQAMYEDDFNSYILMACKIIGVTIGSLDATKTRHSKLNSFIDDYEKKHGKDCKVKINKDMLFDTRDGKIDFELFSLYCAIKSVLGKKEFSRITNETLRYRMLGFKKKSIYDSRIKSKHKDNLLTDFQIAQRVIKLQERGLINYVTHRRRLKMFTTKYVTIDKAEFYELVDEYFTNRNVKKIQQSKINSDFDKLVDKHTKERLTNYTNPEMELVRTGTHN